MERRSHRPGGFNRSIVGRRNEMAAEIAEQEVKMFKVGEPSSAFYPPGEHDPDVIGHTIFDAKAAISPVNEPKGRNGDLAKRRGVIINTLLQEPQSYPVTKQNIGVIERHFGRMLKFAKTLRNKGRLHPGIEEILGL